jgi:hypothetical protein
MPSSRKARLRAGRQMQVELCETSPAGAPEILRNEAYLGYVAMTCPVRLNPG